MFTIGRVVKACVRPSSVLGNQLTVPFLMDINARSNSITAFDNNMNSNIPGVFLAISSVLGVLAAGSAIASCDEEKKKPIKSKNKTENAPGVRSGMKVYTRAEVAKHKSLYTGVWCTFGNGMIEIIV